MKPLKIKCSLTLDPDIVECVKNMAEQNDRFVSQYINLILREKYQATGQGAAAVPPKE